MTLTSVNENIEWLMRLHGLILLAAVTGPFHFPTNRWYNSSKHDSEAGLTRRMPLYVNVKKHEPCSMTHSQTRMLSNNEEVFFNDVNPTVN
jgi:hypothetical protein